MKKIPFFDYPALFRLYEAEFVEAFRNASGRGAFIMQKDLDDFERTLAEYTGAKHAIGVADGTMALLIGLRSAGIRPGDEVLVPSHTFVASAAAAHHAGAVPVLVDCGPDHLMDVASAEKAITNRTSAIMPVQLNGRVANMDAICEVAAKHGLKVIEDSCQALGAKFRGKQAGRFGAVGAFSFYPSKTLGCFGDGGAIITDDDSIADNARMLRDHGRGKSGKVEAWGYNSRLDNIQAALLNVKFRYYDKEVERRRSIARQYHERLKTIEKLRLPPPPDSEPDHYDIFQNYEIEAEDRDELKAYLQDRGVGTIIQWGGYTIHQFEKLGLSGNVPYTESMTQRYLLLPMNVSVDDEAVAYISSAIAEFYRRGTPER
ncbi:DegT/DnrJ/EryC1/StrS aminotransferase family protein [Bradyrhizobium sp. WSM1417]|uniref:DegT/DnrJ/EryC1/StrS family aminotransferase n=1 Tax=Bradyrhizobium sp. WSM1417 TaxID=754500 RepID=UPI0004B5CF82|nr:DegT/DnrJ/EryC1/StrS family aminotransferase [Bradyrhizobium sp. WSM1417]